MREISKQVRCVTCDKRPRIRSIDQTVILNTIEVDLDKMLIGIFLW